MNSGLHGKRLATTRAMLWPEVKQRYGNMIMRECIGKDLEGGGYSLFQGPTLEKLRKISIRIVTFAKIRTTYLANTSFKSYHYIKLIHRLFHDTTSEVTNTCNNGVVTK
jgi:hypothetical protein